MLDDKSDVSLGVGAINFLIKIGMVTVRIRRYKIKGNDKT